MFEESEIHFGYIIIFVTAVGFICSLTYNWGYFWLFDAGIQVLSIGDILTSYSLWVPGVGTLLCGYMFDMYIEQASKRWLNSSKKGRVISKKIIEVSHSLLLTAALFILISFILLGFTYRPILVWISCTYVLASIIWHVRISKILLNRHSQFNLTIFMSVLVALSLLFMLGMDRALSESKLNVANANLYFKPKNERAEPVILLRHLEKGLLVKEIDRKNYILYSWDDIRSVEILTEKSHFKGILGTI